MKSTEIEIEGKKLTVSIKTPKDRESFFLFGVHKSGSTLLNAIVSDVCRRAGIPTINLPLACFEKNININKKENATQLAKFLQYRGYAYIGARTFWCSNIAFDFTKLRKVLLVRDPRDAVISYYYSDMLSHKIPEGNEGWKELRQSLSAANDVNDLEDYLNSKIAWLNQTYSGYAPLIEGANMRIYRYEDVIFYKREWIRNMCDYLEIEISNSDMNTIADKHDLIPAEERPELHIRQVMPGNYKKHFSKKTVDLLNNGLQNVIERFGYNDVPVFNE